MDGHIHSDEITDWTVKTKIVVFDPKTPRDEVHTAYYSIEETTEILASPNESKKHGMENCAPTPILISKTIPFGVGALVTVRSADLTKHTRKCPLATTTSHDKTN